MLHKKQNKEGRLKHRKMIKGVSIIAFLFTPLMAIEIHSPTDAVNIAGKQRMFTQRILKDYAMIGMHNTFGKPDVDLKETIEAFEDHMESLLKYTKNERTKKSIEKVKVLWLPLKKLLIQAPQKEKVGQLQKDLDVLLQASDDTTKLFAKDSGKESGKIVNISGRQRMLSQKMASLYMLRVWGIEDATFKQKLNDAMQLFKVSLEDLEKSDMNTEEIKSLLSKVKRSFMFFEMMNRSKSKFIPALIYKKSNDILVNMNSVTQKYVALQNK